MDRPGVRQVPEGSGEQGKMEKTGCQIICGAPTALAVKGLIMMTMTPNRTLKLASVLVSVPPLVLHFTFKRQSRNKVKFGGCEISGGVVVCLINQWRVQQYDHGFQDVAFNRQIGGGGGQEEGGGERGGAKHTREFRPLISTASVLCIVQLLRPTKVASEGVSKGLYFAQLLRPTKLAPEGVCKGLPLTCQSFPSALSCWLIFRLIKY